MEEYIGKVIGVKNDYAVIQYKPKNGGCGG